MKLHGNAAFSLNQRRHVIRENGSPFRPAAAEVSEPTARKWARRYRSEGEAGLTGPPLGPPTASTSAPPRSGWRRSAPSAIHRGRDRRAAGDGTKDRAGDPGRYLPRQAQPPGARGAPNRYERSRPGELIHIDVKKLGRNRGARRRAPRDRQAREGAALPRRRLGVHPRLRR
jgi:hypothetical protein